MHAVVVRVTVNDGETATRHLRDQIVPRVAEAPGLVDAHWIKLEGGDQGTSVIIFDSEQAARKYAENVPTPPEGVVRVDSVQVGEVVASAMSRQHDIEAMRTLP